MNENIAKYLTQQVMTAPPAKLVFMLYDKAVLSLKEAIAAIEAGNIEGRWKANKRAYEIISHMWSTLDLENGGEIADNLDRLFSFMLSRLPEVDFNNDPAPAQEVIDLLEPLRQAWQQLAQGAGAQGAAGTPSNPAASSTRNPEQAISPTSISA